MADAWGGSFGVAWGQAWGTSVVAPTRGSADAGPRISQWGTHKPRRRIVLVLTADEPVAEPPKLKRKKLSRRVVKEAVAEIAVEQHVEPEVVSAALADLIPKYAFVPQGGVVSDAQLIAAIVRFIREQAEQEDEDDVALLLALI